MSAPTNPPGAAILQSLVANRAPVSATTIAASTAVDLTVKSSWPNAANAPPCAAEIVCTGTGNLQAQLAGESAAQTYAVTAGQVLRGAFVLIPAGNAVACVARW